jgi:hypothetical protein
VIRILASSTPTATPTAAGATPTVTRPVVGPPVVATNTPTVHLVGRLPVLATATPTAAGRRVLQTATHAATATTTRTPTPGPRHSAILFNGKVRVVAHLSTLASLVLTLKPDVAAVGQTVTYVAAGYDKTEKIDVRIHGKCGPNHADQWTSLATTYSDGSGVVADTFTVPTAHCYTVNAGFNTETSNAGAVATIEVRGTKSHASKSATLHVPATTISVAPIAATGGTHVDGAGFQVGEYVFLQYRYYSNPGSYAEDAGVAQADDSGHISLTLPAAYPIVDTRSILAQGVSSAFRASATVKSG